MASETPWKGLHPASILVNLIPRTWRTLLGFWPLLLALAVGGRGVGFRPGDGVFVLIFLGSGALNTLVHSLTLRYRVHERRLEIRQGLLHRQARTIDPARIQNVAMIRNPFHTLSGLVEVRLETAGELRTEGLLSALSVAEAEALIQALDEAKGAVTQVEAPPEDTVLRLGTAELVAYGLSSGSAGLVTVLFAVGMEVLSVLEPERAGAAMQRLAGPTMAALVLVAFAVSWTASAVLAVFRHHGYTLSLRQGPRGPTLGSREGLFTVRDVTMPRQKVQLVAVDEPPLRRLMGFGTLRVETAGLGFSPEGAPPLSEITVPMVERASLAQTATLAIDALGTDPWVEPLRPAHPRALRRALLTALLRGVLFTIPLAVFAWPWGLFALGLVPLLAVTGALDWWSQGWIVTPGAVVVRRGLRRRNTQIIARDKLQSVHLWQSPLLLWNGLARLELRVAGSRVVMPDLDEDEARVLMERLLAPEVAA